MPKNPHCPIDRYQTLSPHSDNPLVQKMLTFTGEPQVLLHWVKKAMIELRESMLDDQRSNRHVAWYARLRLVEELYIRSLFLLFVAKPEEVPHFLSGDFPNSFAYIYDRVNDEILLGRGPLNNRIGDQIFGETSPLKLLNLGAHASYPMLLILNMSEDNEHEPISDPYIEKFLNRYLDNIQDIGHLIITGVDQNTIKAKAIDLHRPE